MGHRALLPLLGLALALSMTGCAGGSAASAGSAEATPTPDDDIALRAAVELVRPRLEGEFSDAYAGLTVDRQARAIVVYRLPRPGLDEAIRADVADVDVVFRPARYSLAEMRRTVDAVLRERAYWQRRGVTIVTAHPRVDGSGVIVVVDRPAPEVPAQLARHYRAVPVQAVPHAPVFPTGSPLPPIQVPG